MTDQETNMNAELVRLILATQEDRDDIEVMPKAYWKARIGRLSDRDRCILAISPANRKVLNEAWRERRDAFVAKLGADNDNRPRMLAAAANGRRETIRFEAMRGVTVTIEPIGGDGWLIILRLLRDDAPPNVGIELYDDRTGMTWLAGKTDAEGVVTAMWDGEGDPRDRKPDLRLRVDGQDVN